MESSCNNEDLYTLDLDEPLDNSDTDEPPAKRPKRPLLESVGNCFQQNKLEIEKRLAKEECKRQAEKVHAKFIKDHIACPTEMARADYIVGTWAKINGVKADAKKKTVQHRARETQPFQNLSKLNSQTTTQSKTRPDSAFTSGQPNNSRPGSFANARSPAHSENLRRNKRYPSAALSSSDLNIGNLNSLNRSTSRETVCSKNSDCVSANSQSSKAANQSASFPNGENQSREDRGNSASEEMNSSLIIVSDNVTPSVSPGKLYVCRVLNCEAMFTSEAKLNHHMNQFSHSPCNPCLSVKDGKLLPDPLCYMCPKCDQDFKTIYQCRAHMRDQDHLPYLPPLKIAGYICPQCLSIFETFDSCWDHIAKFSHRFLSYPFLDDLKGPQPAEVGPIAISEELAMDFLDKCKRVAFRIQCLECFLEIETPAMLRQHIAETNRQHLISSLAHSNPVDIFADYLAEFQCLNCLRLFSSHIPNHFCARDIQGTISESSIKSFHDFIKSCALTLTYVEPESLSVTNCASSSQGQHASCLENLIQVVQHTPEKGAMPKHSIQNSDRTPQPVKGRTRNDNLDSSVIVLDTPPDPGRYKSGEVIEILETEQTIRADSCKNQNKRKRSKPETQSSHLPNTNQTSNTSPLSLASSGFGVNPLAPPISIGGANGLTSNPQGASFGASESNREKVPGQENPSTCQFGTQTSFLDLTKSNAGPAQNSSSEAKKCSALPSALAEDSHGRLRTNKGVCSPRPRSRTPTGNTVERAETDWHRERSRSPTTPLLTSTEHLIRMKSIIFLDLDNFSGFFNKLPRRLPDLTFIWGFYGGKIEWREPYRCFVFTEMKRNNQFYLHERCGVTKDAADFAIVLTVGQMHERLPKHIPFTIISGDKGFIEVERQMRATHRKAVVIDPHAAQKFSNDMIYTMVTSVIDT